MAGVKARHFIFGLLLLLWHQPSWAWDANNFELEKEIITVETIDDTAIEIAIQKTFTNTSSFPTSLTWYEPTKKSAKNFTFFVEAEGFPFAVANTRPKLIQRITHEMEIKKSADFLPLVASDWTQLFVSDPISFERGETKTLKLTFTLTADEENDWQALKLFRPRQKSADFFSFSFQTPQPVGQLWHNLPATESHLSFKSPMTFYVETTHQAWQTDIDFLWTEDTTAAFTSGKFSADFLLRPAPTTPTSVVLLVDTSGSMSDNAWNINQQLIRALLEEFPEDINVQLRFFGKNITDFPETPEPNSRELLKSITEKLQFWSPVGKTHFADAVVDLPTSDRVIVISDDQEVFVPEDTDADWLFFHFELPAEQILSLKKNGGKTFGLWRHDDGFSQKNDALLSLKRFRPPLNLPSQNPLTKPTKITDYQTQHWPLFVTQKEITDKTNRWPALAQYWTRHQIADILSQPIISSQNIADLLAIGRIFGVKTELFNQDTFQGTLANTLKTTSLEARATIAYHLRQQDFFVKRSDLQWVNNTPFYLDKVEKVWRAYNFAEKVRSDRLVKIAPYSEAQRKLLAEFPEIFADFFALGPQVEFCAPIRCFSIKKGHRETFQLQDRAFLRDFDANHWANDYILTMIDRGLYLPEANGKLHPNRAIDRGEFADWIVKYTGFRTFNLKHIDPDRTFADVPLDHPQAVSLYALKNAKIVKGYADNTFRPLSPITRAEAVKILLSVQNIEPKDDEKSADFFVDTPGWERSWALAAHQHGIITGRQDDNKKQYFDPARPITRAEAAKIIIKSKRE